MLQTRLKMMEERARITDERLKEISSKKISVKKRIYEVNVRRTMIERDLRSEQLNLLEMRVSAFKTGEEPSEILQIAAKEEINSLEKKLSELDGELRALEEEEKSLDQDLKDTQVSHVRVVQVLQALRSELDKLMSNIRI